MSLQDIESIVNSVQSAVVAVGFIVAGVWAILMFRILDQKKHAKAELAALQRELIEQGVIDLNIKAEEYVSQNDELFISTAVNIRNNGNRLTKAKYRDKGCLIVTQIDLSGDGEPIWEESCQPLRRYGLNGKSAHLFPGELIIETFLTKIPGPGAYLLTFEAVVARFELDILDDPRPKSDGDQLAWETHHLIIVDKSADS